VNYESPQILFNLDQIERAKAAALPMSGSGRG